jgi:hypothetical protein
MMEHRDVEQLLVRLDNIDNTLEDILRAIERGSKPKFITLHGIKTKAALPINMAHIMAFPVADDGSCTVVFMSGGEEFCVVEVPKKILKLIAEA